MGNIKSNKSPKRLSTPKKKVAVNVMKDEGYKPAEMAEWLGISVATAWRYSKVETPEKLKEFEAEFKRTINLMKYEGMGQVYKKLNELIPKEKYIGEVVKAGEFLEGGNNNNVQNIQTNIVVMSGELKNKYGIPRSTEGDNQQHEKV